jgi:hypothetical protein
MDILIGIITLLIVLVWLPCVLYLWWKIVWWEKE